MVILKNYNTSIIFWTINTHEYLKLLHQWFTNYGTQTPIIFVFLLHTYIHSMDP